jgi:hypothetical protein
MDTRLLVAKLRSAYIWTPYSSPVAKNIIRNLILELGGSLPTESEMTVALRQQNG